MLHHLKKNILSFLNGVRSALSPAAALPPPPEESGKHGKNKQNRRSSRRSESRSGAPYVRAADRRAVPDRREKSRGKKAAPEKVPRSSAGSPAREKKTPPPMPAYVPPPVEEGKLRFCDLELTPEVLAATQTLEFRYCTGIQEKCLPAALSGSDLAAKAQTGTGKTAAFLASTISRLQKKPLPEEQRKPGSCRVLVLAPTRELAIQIHQDAEGLAQYTGLNNLVIFGGMDHKGQREALRYPVDILIGTPGRILDYSRSGHLDLSRTEVLVIDEADRMLDMGFIPDVRRIISQLPPTGKRQTMLFSATLEPAILRLADSWLKNPIFVESEPEHVITDLIDQKFYAVLSEQKLPFLLYLIRTLTFERMLIFGNMKHHNRDLVRQLYSYGVDAELLSGDVPQEKRLKVLERFRSGQIRILVATDVAARGIHVDGITHVVNYDLPEQPDDYVHRIGRTGRAGEHGVSISFVCEMGAFFLPAIEKYAGMEVHTVQPEPEMMILPERVRRAPESGDEDRPFSGSRSSGRRGGGPRRGRR
ncbi:MAG: DEAD/DEAH box helicase [Lentisphaeria bacterium]|nr:DEAD/DEAH box helicase [Lentisphaeria bacterium]